MRVGLVIYGSLDTISGGYLYDRQLVAHLRAAGDTVEIFSLPWRNYAQHLADNFSDALYQNIASAPLDALIEDELNHPSLLRLNRRLRRHVSFPIVSLVHHLRCYEAHPRVWNALYRRVERAYLDTIDAFILNSETTRRAVCDVLARSELARAVVAYPAGDRFQTFEVSETSKVSNTPQAISDDTITARAKQPGPLRVVFVGNVIARKGLHILLDALARLPRENFTLNIVGKRDIDAAYTRQLDAKMRAQNLNNVNFAGALSDEELARVLRTSHVLAVPSDYEGYGIVYLEGMSFGLPALATTAGAAREIISDGENGFLISPNDAPALAQHLARFASDRAFLAQCALAARARFLRQPGWEASMARVRAALLEWQKTPRGF
jgi:glycosyltransferase involved in cell wall biosynthesis